MTIDKIPECRWCGHNHGEMLCPHVKAFEYEYVAGPDGDIPRVTRVEYLTPIDRPKFNPDEWKGVKP